MLIKTADDKSKRIALLESLQAAPVLDRRQKEWMANELWRLRQGVQGERDAAHYIDSHFGDGQNHAVIHDLRIVVDGQVAQIDHLLIGRSICYLLETKCFGGNLIINEQGEFSVTYAGRRTFGIESPIEQSRRHEKVLRKLFQQLGIQTRTGQPMEMQHVVLVHPKATITRPKAQAFDTSNVIKADQLPSWHARFVDKDLGALKLLSLAVNVRGSGTVREWAEKVSRQHRPADLLALPEFMRVGHDVAVDDEPAALQHAASVASNISETTPDDSPKRLVCASCGVKISYAEGKFCWNNTRRFGGAQYCREHQGQFR